MLIRLTALRTALLFAIYILLDKASYDAKSRPRSDLKKFVHWLLLGFHPLRSAFNRQGEFLDVDGRPLHIHRVVGTEDGLYRVELFEQNAPIVESKPEPTHEFDAAVEAIELNRFAVCGFAGIVAVV